MIGGIIIFGVLWLLAIAFIKWIDSMGEEYNDQ
mgnify:CR=1 FL=1